MRERATTLALALAAFAAFLVMFRGGAPHPAGKPPPRPTSVERAGGGLSALGAWLRRDGRRVVSWSESYERLGDAASAGTGHLLIVALPGRVAIETRELPALDRWVRAGNTLLVLAALVDAPEWAAGGESPAFDLEALTGLAFTRGDAGPGDAPARERRAVPRTLAAPRRHIAQPSRAHPLLEGVRSLHARSVVAPGSWRLRLPFETFALELAREWPSEQGVLWLRRLGAGRVVVSGYGSLFCNDLLGEGDNARLLANLVATSLGPHGTVLVDDGRQGLTADYDPQQFYADPRLHWSIAIVVAVWLCWALAGTRLRAPLAATCPPVPDEVQLLRRTASFMERVTPPAAAAIELVAAFSRRLARRHRLPAATQPPWEWLEARLGAGSPDLLELRRRCADVASGRPVRLSLLHNLLLRLESRL